MRVAIVGAGPAGLVCARTFAKLGAEVTVYERRARDDAPGLGITLPAVARKVIEHKGENGGENGGEPLATTRPWSSAEVMVNGESFRFPYAELVGVSRAGLLDYLVRGCEAAGATLRYGATVDPATLEADLVVGADGVDSVVRAAADFGTSIAIGENQFAWLGLGIAVSEMKIGFAQTPHGLVITAAYPFTATRSTFIVEGSPRAVGALAIAERFPLVDTPVRWRQFRQVRTQRLAHGRYALIGDAAGSIYYSFGAGTAMAVQSGGMLASLIMRAGSVAAGLAAYEATHRPRLEGVQRAAEFDLHAMAQLDGIPPIADGAAFAHGYVTRFG